MNDLSHVIPSSRSSRGPDTMVRCNLLTAPSGRYHARVYFFSAGQLRRVFQACMFFMTAAGHIPSSGAELSPELSPSELPDALFTFFFVALFLSVPFPCLAFFLPLVPPTVHLRKGAQVLTFEGEKRHFSKVRRRLRGRLLPHHHCLTSQSLSKLLVC